MNSKAWDFPDVAAGHASSFCQSTSEKRPLVYPGLIRQTDQHKQHVRHLFREIHLSIRCLESSDLRTGAP